MLKKLWLDEGGALLSMEAVLLATILVIGVIVGLSAVQVAVVTELADVAAAVGSISQTYSSGGATGHHAATAGFAFDDANDACDETNSSGNNGATSCVSICTNVDNSG